MQWLSGSSWEGIRGIPFLGSERRKPPGDPCLIAVLIGYAADPGRFECPANRRTVLVDGAVYRHPDLALQGNTARIFPVGSNHDPSEIIQFLCQIYRNTTGCCIIRFTPVERRPIVCAACTTAQTRIYFTHTNRLSCCDFCGRRNINVQKSAGLYELTLGKLQQKFATV